MGNSNWQQEQFNPEFNFNQYMRKLDAIRHQYGHHNQLDNINAGFAPNYKKTQTVNCQEIQRNAYIYKPSIEIQTKGNGNLTVEFSYDTLGESQLEIHVGVTNIQQNIQTKKTQTISSKMTYKDVLKGGKKNKYQNTFNISQFSFKQFLSEGILIRILFMDQVSQYSVSFMKKTNHWKTVVQKFQKGAEVFGIEDIYGGEGENQECIICMSETAISMVKPCNHVCFCGDCSKQMLNKTNNCPICRKKIMNIVTFQK